MKREKKKTSGEASLAEILRKSMKNQQFRRKSMKFAASGGLVAWWPGGLVVWLSGGLVAWWSGWPGGLVVWLSGGLVVWWCGGLVVCWLGGLNR